MRCKIVSHFLTRTLSDSQIRCMHASYTDSYMHASYTNSYTRRYYAFQELTKLRPINCALFSRRNIFIFCYVPNRFLYTRRRPIGISCRCKLSDRVKSNVSSGGSAPKQFLYFDTCMGCVKLVLSASSLALEHLIRLSYYIVPDRNLLLARNCEQRM